jgi:hypothetical protein
MHAVMSEYLRDASARGWSPEEIRSMLFGETAEQAFESSFHSNFSGGSRRSTPNSV